MYWASQRFTWIPLYIFLLYLLIKQYKKQTWLILLFVALAIILSDQISTQAFKLTFQRYRPCHNFIIQAQLHLNGSCGGMYGFVSSHAANTFALATLLSLLLYKRIKYFTPIIFSWAIFVSYSRIYNGVHYPADIAVGAILGCGIGYAMFILHRYFAKKVVKNRSSN